MQKAAPQPHGPVGRLLEHVCGAVAMLGGLLLVAIMLVSSVSVIGRGLSLLLATRISGIPGDVEIVQLGCAMAVFSFLPLCQLKRANVLFLALSFTLALQLGHGTVEKFVNRDTTMVLRVPEGWAYAVALACAWLLVVVTAYTVARSALEISTNRAIGPPPSGEH